MDTVQLTALLHRSESETLDFKSKQYQFAGATDSEKGELLKDIISIANAWKDTDGYIVIGIEEENGRSTRVCGADATLRDSDVQQFVNSKTNCPISFRIELHEYKGATLTLIQIDKAQKRPIYLTKNFGELKKNVVYLRRGSSTDEAAPDEIADMGREFVPAERPQVTLEFEFIIETWTRRFIGGPPIYRDPEEDDHDFLTVFAINQKGGLAQYVQGSIWIPAAIDWNSIINGKIPHAKSPEDIAGQGSEKVEISNRFSDAPRREFMSPPEPYWHPLSPGMRLRLEKRVIPPYREWLKEAPCSIRWQLSVNGGEPINGETKFADIPLIDKRRK